MRMEADAEADTGSSLEALPSGSGLDPGLPRPITADSFDTGIRASGARNGENERRQWEFGPTASRPPVCPRVNV